MKRRDLLISTAVGALGAAHLPSAAQTPRPSSPNDRAAMRMVCSSVWELYIGVEAEMEVGTKRSITINDKPVITDAPKRKGAGRKYVIKNPTGELGVLVDNRTHRIFVYPAPHSIDED